MPESQTAAPGRYRPSPACPALPSWGIRLAAPRTIVREPELSLPLAGAFRLRDEEVRAFGMHILRAVAVVVRTPLAFAYGPARGEVLFDDDVERDGDGIIGYFNSDAARELALPHEVTRIYVSASILAHRSEVLVVDVVSPALARSEEDRVRAT